MRGKNLWIFMALKWYQCTSVVFCLSVVVIWIASGSSIKYYVRENHEMAPLWYINIVHCDYVINFGEGFYLNSYKRDTVQKSASDGVGITSS